MGVEPKIGVFNPKMDGLFQGKPYEQMDDFGGVNTPIFGGPPIFLKAEKKKTFIFPLFFFEVQRQCFNQNKAARLSLRILNPKLWKHRFPSVHDTPKRPQNRWQLDTQNNIPYGFLGVLFLEEISMNQCRFHESVDALLNRNHRKFKTPPTKTPVSLAAKMGGCSRNGRLMVG